MAAPIRIAITGLGTICGVGNSTKDVWPGILEGKSGVTTIENTDTEKVAVKIGGEVKDFTVDEDLLNAKEAPRFDRYNHYALQAAKEALNHSCDGKLPYGADKVGCILGVGMGGFHHIETYHGAYLNRGARRVSPFFIPGIIPNMASGLVSLKLGLKGINYTTSSACASAGHALNMAAYEIQLGRHDMVISGGAEGVLCGFTIAAFQVMKALSRRNEEPAKASRPFDKDRDGFVMGEGAGVLVLENYDKAKARGAKILAELVGYGASSDVYHITAPRQDGLGAIQAMNQALTTAGISKEEIHYINAHGTSTPLGDAAETGAIKSFFGKHAYDLNVSSTKSMTGHLLGAAGGIESVFCVKALESQIAPPTINLDNPDPACDLNYTAHKPQEREIEYALNNSFGFGGTNSALIFKKA